MNLLITLPASTKWSEYEKELKKAESGEILNFKVFNLPKKVQAGDKCYVVHCGHIRGWMLISGFSEKSFVCTTTGKQFDGKFVERTGEFHKLKNPVPHKGFQGFRYTEEI